MSKLVVTNIGTNSPEQGLELVIPFCGFYESWALSIIYDAINPDDDEPPRYNEDDIDYNLLFAHYAVAYTKALFDYIDQEEIDLKLEYEFKEMKIPGEYNFSTDLLTVTMPEAEVKRLYAHVIKHYKDRLAELVREGLTPRDGFIPFFSNDVDDWGDVTTWEPAQMRYLFDALDCMDSGDYPVHLLIMDSAIGNGVITEIIEKSMRTEV